MSITHSIAHNTIVQIVGKATSTILGLAAVALMTRYLGSEKFGWYVTAAGFLQFVGILSDFGFAVITSKMLSEPEYDKNKIYNTLFSWRFATGLLFNAITPLIFLAFPYPAPVKIAVAVMALSYFTASLNQIFIAYFQTKMRMYIVMIGENLSRILLVAGIALSAFMNLGFLAAMLVITISSACYTIYLYIKSKPVKFEFDKQISRAMFIIIWPTALAVIFNSFYLQGDRVILPLYATQSQVGLYGAAYRVIDIITQIGAMIMGVMLPLLTYAWSRKLIDEFKRMWQMSFNLIFLFFIPITVGIFVLSTPIMKIFGNEFAPAGQILRLLSVAIIGLTLGAIGGYSALAISRQRQALWVYISDAILSIIGYFVFIPRFGAIGAAWVTIFSEIYAGILLLSIVIYYEKIRLELMTAIKIILAGIIMGLIIHYLQPMHIVISILFGFIIYAILVVLFKIISKRTILEILTIPANSSKIIAQ